MALVTACVPAAQPDGNRLEVLAAFYPLQYVVEQVGGDRVDVTSLTPPGAEPHDVALSPAQVRRVGEVDLVAYLPGFQAATDEAVAARQPEHVVAAGTGSRDDTSELASDPHFWLDPTLLAEVGDDVAHALTELEPASAGAFAARAHDLETRLHALDEEFAVGLAHCAGATLVTSHEAFGYLARRYGLVQVGISGIDPAAEPSPARLREVGAVVEQNGVETLFFEVLVSPKVTTVLAGDLGVRTAVLDPIEGHTDDAVDYLGTMRANLESLRGGLTCTG
ncbi:metal ABC transporter substrate-binding protein [Pengzhenrongella sicca]|nr:metal ABC transporter substrate-binding protein [Pengzhenrongella sicca]